jgi:hypothetical protein
MFSVWGDLKTSCNAWSVYTVPPLAHKHVPLRWTSRMEVNKTLTAVEIVQLLVFFVLFVYNYVLMELMALAFL